MSRELRVLTPAELAHRGGVVPRTVIKWAKLGLLPTIITPSGRHLFEEAGAMRFLEQRRRGHTRLGKAVSPANGAPTVAGR
jgi:predicted site-specific integrase-resolvase